MSPADDESLRPVALGLADFCGALIRELFVAVGTAPGEQHQRIVEIAASAAADVNTLAAQVPADRVAAELKRIFPSKDPRRAHALASGSPYRPAGEKAREDPPLAERLGVILSRSDWQRRGSSAVLRRAAAAKAESAVRLLLAEAEQSRARALLAGGIPQVAVDSGRISVRLVLELDESQSRSDGPRLLVRPAGQTAPNSLNVLTGEVELQFKTLP